MRFGGETDGWVKLIDLDHKYSPATGSVFRFPSQYPYEEYVDYILCFEYMGKKNRFFVVSTGRRAGRIWDSDPEIKLESKSGEFPMSDSEYLDVGWLIKNWKRCCYPHCEPDDVYYNDGMPVPEYPIHLALRSKLRSEQDPGRK